MKTTFFSREHKREATSIVVMLRFLMGKSKNETSNYVLFDIMIGFENIHKAFEWLLMAQLRAQFPQLNG